LNRRHNGSIIWFPSPIPPDSPPGPSGGLFFYVYQLRPLAWESCDEVPLLPHLNVDVTQADPQALAASMAILRGKMTTTFSKHPRTKSAVVYRIAPEYRPALRTLAEKNEPLANGGALGGNHRRLSAEWTVVTPHMLP